MEYVAQITDRHPTALTRATDFLLAFFTSYITDAIDYRYGYIFAACNLAGADVVYFFVLESQGRSLEEIDTMYVTRVTPWKSTGWVAPEGEELGQTDKAVLTAGARDIEKDGVYGEERREIGNEGGRIK